MLGPGCAAQAHLIAGSEFCGKRIPHVKPFNGRLWTHLTSGDTDAFRFLSSLLGLPFALSDFAPKASSLRCRQVSM